MRSSFSSALVVNSPASPSQSPLSRLSLIFAVEALVFCDRSVAQLLLSWKTFLIASFLEGIPLADLLPPAWRAFLT